MDEVREAWDRAAAGFDAEPDHGLRDRAVRHAWQQLMQRLLPVPPARVADLGCGTGSLSVLLAERGHHVTGVDLSPKMIALAEKKARAAGVAVEFCIGDAADPRLPAGSFDVVLSRHVFWALADPGAAFRRWLRLLNAEGRVVMIEGRWSTGAGFTSTALRRVIDEHSSEIRVEPLHDPSLWGKQISDERYALVARARRTAGLSGR